MPRIILIIIEMALGGCMTKNVFVEELENFKSLMKFGARMIVMNIENGEPALDDLHNHLSQMNKSALSGKVDVNKCFEACSSWFLEYGGQGLTELMNNSIDMSQIFKQMDSDANSLNQANHKIPDGWVVLAFPTSKSTSIYKIFSNWHFINNWHISSGASSFDDLQEYEDYFTWKQESGTSYKLEKNRYGHFSDFALLMLEVKFTTPTVFGKKTQVLQINELIQQLNNLNR